jgi:hypothetical protein
MGYELEKLKAHHKVIMDLHVQGFTNREIASQLGMSEVGVGGILNCTLVQDELAKRTRKNSQITDQIVASTVTKAMGFLEERAFSAAEQLALLAQGATSESVKLAANNSLLDRVGLSEVRKDSVSSAPSFQITQNLAVFIKQVMEEDRGGSEEQKPEYGKFPHSGSNLESGVESEQHSTPLLDSASPEIGKDDEPVSSAA